MKNLNAIDWVVLILVIIGGINWGLVGAMKLDLVTKIFGVESVISRIVYILVGLSALYLLLIVGKLKKE